MSTSKANRGILRIALVLAAALLLAACGRTTLYSNLDERQANEVLAALLSTGVNADKRLAVSKSGWEIRVDDADFPYAMQVLQSRGLPRQQYSSLGDIFKKEGFASSSLEEMARLKHGLQQEMARTLSSYPGVVDARVHINLPERDPLGGTSSDASASVVIFEQSGANLRDKETEMKVVVKDGVPGLNDVNKVTVKFTTVPGPSENRQGQRGTTAIAMSAVSPMAIALVAAVVGLIGLLLAFGGRLRQRLQGQPKQTPRVWNG
ncbi:type III secretion inner membrane ring lipoprotein SctJ [Luteimonas sp. SJ-92]|uniref:Lipoprotein n=1 Tax=Luteimonas salinisoli TaxID=2752307 RepID=A0A853JD66_9GAMM|nr:type III secretion inner membrane ring lipoprotein SctJ [Luteimonas salinisoli]NZA26785.1 type III secretion inner membrane ring lipoprotein SctJ [Luteimonas salinisoli]